MELCKYSIYSYKMFPLGQFSPFPHFHVSLFIHAPVSIQTDEKHEKQQMFLNLQIQTMRGLYVYFLQFDKSHK